MTASVSKTAGRLVAAALAGVVMLGLQACATTDMPQPKYPVYMQDKPAEAAPPVAEETPAPVPAAPVITPPASNGGITTAELAPPPPPPPPAEDTTAVAAVPAKAAVVAPAKAPVRDSRAAYIYVLSAHDTLYGVSRRFGVPVKILYDINGLEPTATLRIGEKILLPEGASDKGAEEHANGPTMVRLSTALASNTAPSKSVTAAPKPVTAPAPGKPAVTAPAAVVKPAVMPPATTVAAATPKPVATTPTKPAVTAPPPVKPAVTTSTPVPAPSKPAAKPVSAPAPAPTGFPSNSQIAQMGRGMFAWPVKGKIIVPFGQLAPNVRNDGINISASSGTEVRAAADGVVVYEGDQVKELGNTVYIKHPNGWYTGYSHLSDMNVSNNQTVKKGEVIGTVGQTGTIDQPQLHFEVRYTPSTDIARPVDPDLVLP
ncbi:MAG: M23 family metallopeptidase [Asticcacaulis sp.]|nr:M23 family metallopeptidase [Asticcacaulis sp.]